MSSAGGAPAPADKASQIAHALGLDPTLPLSELLLAASRRTGSTLGSQLTDTQMREAESLVLRQQQQLQQDQRAAPQLSAEVASRLKLATPGASSISASTICRSCMKRAPKLCWANGRCQRAASMRFSRRSGTGTTALDAREEADLQRVGGLGAHNCGDITRLGFRTLGARIELCAEDVFCGHWTMQLAAQSRAVGGVHFVVAACCIVSVAPVTGELTLLHLTRAIAATIDVAIELIIRNRNRDTPRRTAHIKCWYCNSTDANSPAWSLQKSNSNMVILTAIRSASFPRRTWHTARQHPFATTYMDLRPLDPALIGRSRPLGPARMHLLVPSPDARRVFERSYLHINKRLPLQREQQKSTTTTQSENHTRIVETAKESCQHHCISSSASVCADTKRSSNRGVPRGRKLSRPDPPSSAGAPFPLARIHPDCSTFLPCSHSSTLLHLFTSLARIHPHIHPQCSTFLPPWLTFIRSAPCSLRLSL